MCQGACNHFLLGAVTAPPGLPALEAVSRFSARVPACVAPVQISDISLGLLFRKFHALLLNQSEFQSILASNYPSQVVQKDPNVAEIIRICSHEIVNA